MAIFQKLANQNVKARFAVSLVGNFLRLLVSFLTTLYLARSMGPANFGDFHFLMNSFQGLRALLDLGAQVAFFTFISQQKREIRFYSHYLAWLTIQFLCMTSFILYICPPSLLDTLWLGMDRKLILLAFLASFAMNQCWEVSTNIGESVRATLGIQLRNLIAALVYLATLFTLHQWDCLFLPQVYLSISALYLTLGFLHIGSLRKSFLAEPEALFSYLQLSRQYLTYCLPLAVTYVMGSVQAFIENWMLQKFGGSIQQGFFMLGSRFSTICLLATTALTKIFWKEIAEAFMQENQEHIRKLLFSTLRLLYSSSAALSGFLVPFAPLLLVHFVGREFENAWMVLSILFVFPVHQGLGWMLAAFFQATERTRLYRNLSILNMVLSVVLAYFVLAPKEAFIGGLNGGSAGMALKMLLLNILSVNLGLHFVKKHTEITLPFRFQTLVLSFFLGMGWLCHQIFAPIFPSADQNMMDLVFWLLLSGCLYGIGCLLAGWFFPRGFGITNQLKEKILTRIRETWTKKQSSS